MGIRDDITSRIIVALEAGTPPWRAGWKGGTLAYNADTNKPYQGINQLITGLSYSDPRWCTFKQAQKNGWRINKGEKATRIVKMVEVARDTPAVEGDDVLGEDGRSKLIMRGYDVFNAEQMSGIAALPARNSKTEMRPTARADAVIKGLELDGLRLNYDGTISCCFYPGRDTISMIPHERFSSVESLYQSLLHECGHATGITSRTNRLNSFARFGSEEYAREELVAELTAVQIGVRLELQGPGGSWLSEQHLQNHAAYIGSWLRVLKSDRNEIFVAAAAAEKACNWLVEHAVEPRPVSAPAVLGFSDPQARIALLPSPLRR